MRPLVVVVALLTVVAPITGATAAFGADAGDSTATAPATADQVTITVIVVDSAGNGIGDATVTVSWDGGNRSRTTAGNGKAFVTVPDDERLEIAVDHPEFVRNLPVTVRNVVEGQEIEVGMTPPATETVTVVDEDGDPIEDARVSLIKSGQFRSVADGRTGANGTFTATGIEEGEYRIQLLRSGYDQKRVSVDVAGDSEHTVTMESNRTRVNFRVTDGRLGDGIEAQVSVRSGGEEILSFRTGENGRAQQLLPVNTDYTVVVQREGYDQSSQRFEVNQRETSVALTINRTDALSLSAETTQILAGNTLSVTVTDEYGERVEGATITVDGESVATTDADGEATVRLEEPGEYDLVATDDRAESDPVTVRAVSAATTTAQPTTTAPPTTTAQPTTPEPTTAAPTTTAPATTTATAASGTTASDGGGGAPGFLVVTALGGLLGGLLALRHRRR